MTTTTAAKTRDVTVSQAQARKMRDALRIVAAGIWRDKKRNACGLHGGAAAVHAVEKALGRRGATGDDK